MQGMEEFDLTLLKQEKKYACPDGHVIFIIIEIKNYLENNTWLQRLYMPFSFTFFYCYFFHSL